MLKCQCTESLIFIKRTLLIGLVLLLHMFLKSFIMFNIWIIFAFIACLLLQYPLRKLLLQLTCINCMYTIHRHNQFQIRLQPSAIPHHWPYLFHRHAGIFPFTNSTEYTNSVSTCTQLIPYSVRDNAVSREIDATYTWRASNYPV